MQLSSTVPVSEPCRIVGVLDDGVASLSDYALTHLTAADVVVGGTRVLALFADHISPDAQRFDLTGQLMNVPDWIREAQSKRKRVVVLATGDPLCHGIAGFLQARLCIESCEIIPNVSMVQIACARLGIPWHDIKILSVHSRDAGEWSDVANREHGLYSILKAARLHSPIAIFTSPDNTPSRIARMLIHEGLDGDVRMAVAECLLQKHERIVTEYTISDIATQRFADPNVVVLWRSKVPERSVFFGLADNQYRQRQPDKGLITKREVRAVSLARLQLRQNSVVWDIGAGSGAVGLEAARLCVEGYVYAIEKNADDAVIANENRRVLGVHNYTLVHGKAPKGMESWPSPDAVFIGGSGGELNELIDLCLARLSPRGWLVMNFVTFENVARAIATLKNLGVHWDITQLQASRSRPILDMNRLAAENPVWIVCASRENVDDR